ncbi:MAG: hypothetical protein K6T73_09685 [Candidatus Bathyarchaeota archaeon]|nr:hypothetical protein [Candidatus Bathyarchaeota archaeon]
MNIIMLMKIIAAVATALSDGKLTKDEAKQIISLIIDLFLPDALTKK